MPNDLTNVVTTRVDLVPRGAVRDPDNPDQPAFHMIYKAEDEPAKGEPGGTCALCNGDKTIRSGAMKCPDCGGTGIVPAGGPLNKADEAAPVFDPATDNSPETDTDHDFWTADGKPIAAAWQAVGKPVPMVKSEAWDGEWSLALGAIAKADNDPNVGGGVDRSTLPASAFAGPNRSFPIVKPGDVSDAASSLGRAGADGTSDAAKAGLRARIKAAIIRIAKSKGAAFVAALPDAWKGTETATAKSDDDPNAGASGAQPTNKETHMPEPVDDKPKADPVAATTEINKAELTPEVRAYLEKQEKAAADAATELAKAQGELAETTKIAKEERDFRLNATYLHKAETDFAHLPRTFEPVVKAEGEHPVAQNESFAAALRELDEKAPMAAKILTPMLKSADALLAKGDFFREFGSGGSNSDSSAASPLSKIEGITSQIMKDEKGPGDKPLSHAQAYDLAIQRNPALYEESRQFKPVGASK